MDNRSVLLQFWKLAAEKEGWYPPYADALKDVNVELANWRAPGIASNTIWETVTHINFYKERLLKRLKGEKDLSLGTNDDTFRVTGNSEADWQAEVEKLFSIHSELFAALSKLNDADLDKALPKEAAGAQFMNLIVHDAYHTGQIILLRKLKGEWPEKRSFV